MLPMTNNTNPIDPRQTFANAVATAGTTVAAIRPEQFGLPTPCQSFNVRQIVGHMVAVLDRATALGQGNDPMALPEVIENVADEEWPRAWTDAEATCTSAWTDDALLSAMFTLPWATMPGAGIMNMYTSEITTHTWDLAEAIGVTPNWDDETVAISFASIHQGLPADGRVEMLESFRPSGDSGWIPPFGRAVAVPPDAPLIDRLVAWTGRHPTSAA